jgi:hypothetical protein
MVPVHSVPITFQIRRMLSKHFRDMLRGEKAIQDVKEVSDCFWSFTAHSLSFHNMWLPVPLLSCLDKGKPQSWTVSEVLPEST